MINPKLVRLRNTQRDPVPTHRSRLCTRPHKTHHQTTLYHICPAVSKQAVPHGIFRPSFEATLVLSAMTSLMVRSTDCPAGRILAPHNIHKSLWKHRRLSEPFDKAADEHPPSKVCLLGVPPRLVLRAVDTSLTILSPIPQYSNTI